MLLNNKKKANLDQFVSSYDELKRQGSIVTNSFFNINILSKYFNEKDCIICNYAKSFYVLIPFYDYYEIQFYTLSLQNLEEDLNNLKQIYSQKLLKIRLITRDIDIEDEYHSLFEKNGFQRKGRLVRMVIKSQGITKYTEVLRECIEEIPSQYRHVGYAEEKDANQVLDLLESEFDEVLDSLPEMDEILENIKNKQIIVVKDDNGRVLSARYFTIEGSTCNVIYDVTHKDFRKLSIFYQVIIFFVDEVRSHHLEFKRSFGWRNVKRTELLKFSKAMDEVPDGTVISVYIK